MGHKTKTAQSRLPEHYTHLNINYEELCRRSITENPNDKTNHMLAPEWLDTVENTHNACKETSDETASSATLETVPNRDATVIKDILCGVIVSVP